MPAKVRPPRKIDRKGNLSVPAADLGDEAGLMGPRDHDRRNQRQRKSAAMRKPDPPHSGGWARLLLLVCLVALAYFVAQRQGLIGLTRFAQSPATPGSGAPAWPAFGCGDDFPPAGTVKGDPQWYSGAPGRSVTTFANRTAADRIVDLLQGERVLASIAVPANTNAVVELPVGAHDWRFRAGAAWCSRGWRFVREQRTAISNPLEIVASSQLTVDISPDPDHPTGFALRTRDAPVVSAGGEAASPSATQSTADGTLLVPRSSNGHYFVDGSVDGEPVRFLIDTGASRIALPVTLARRLGYYQGREVIVQTASGQTTASEFRVRRITFGPFSAEDVTVVAMLNLETPLLGMSLLQSIELRQTVAGLEMRRAR
jgi:aspartyl protease family protein